MDQALASELGIRRCQYLHTTEVALEVEVQKSWVLGLPVWLDSGRAVVRIEVAEVTARVSLQNGEHMAEELD